MAVNIGFGFGTVTLILFVSLAATALRVRGCRVKGGYFFIYGFGLLNLLCVEVFHRSMMDYSLQQKIITDLPVENSNDVGNESSIFHNTIELFFMGNKTLAREYLVKNPFENFKYYTHDLPAGVASIDAIIDCLEDGGYGREGSAFHNKSQFLLNLCDWSQSICNPTTHTHGSQYSTSRLNNNMDAVIAQLFTSYHGKIRTFNKTGATIKVVPFLAESNYRCSQVFQKRRNDKSKDILLDEHKRSKLFYDPATLYLFMKGPTLTCNKLISGGQGQLVVPYVNTNAEYQPDNLMFSMSSDELDQFFSSKKYALAAVLAKKISGNGYARVQFVDKADKFFGNGTIESNNGTLGGMPVHIRVMQHKRKMVGEADTMQKYRDSVFCPVFRGDEPNQKRFFDALLSGCIPVVMAHYFGETDTSYFAPGVDNRRIYPWAKGSFGEFPEMGIDYSKLVVEINETDCGEMDCLPGKLEKWLSDPEALRQKQLDIAKYARLFSYGLQDKAFKYADAMSALLVRARHYVVYEAASTTSTESEV